MSSLVTRSFDVDAPDWLLPIYNVCQESLDAILADSTQVDKLYDVALRDANGKFRLAGDIEKDVKKIITDDLSGHVPNAGWYRNILAHNIISILNSSPACGIASSRVSLCETVRDEQSATTPLKREYPPPKQ